MLKFRVREVVDYEDTHISNFVIEYLDENEKACNIAFACCSYGAEVESFQQLKKGRRSRDQKMFEDHMTQSLQREGSQAIVVFSNKRSQAKGCLLCISV